jgi:uncharacterized protein
MGIAITDNPEAEQFEISVDGKSAGIAAYRRKPELIAFIHTEVDPAFSGQGLGSKLIAGALDAVAEQGLSVLPFCPFVNNYIAEHDEYLALVPPAMRSQFGLPAS